MKRRLVTTIYWNAENRPQYLADATSLYTRAEDQAGPVQRGRQREDCSPIPAIPVETPDIQAFCVKKTAGIRRDESREAGSCVRNRACGYLF